MSPFSSIPHHPYAWQSSPKGSQVDGIAAVVKIPWVRMISLKFSGVHQNQFCLDFPAGIRHPSVDQEKLVFILSATVHGGDVEAVATDGGNFKVLVSPH
jgi:hypothetical protein